MTDQERYQAAAHAMQTGVKIDHAKGSTDGSPKHLRVGINACAVDHAALVWLLIAKGVIDETEYVKEVADEMEREKQRYEERLGVGLA